MRRVLVESQIKTGCASGSWDPDKPEPDAWGRQGGRLMLTSLSALTLEIYYRYLPLYKLDKPAADAKPADAKSEPAKPAAEQIEVQKIRPIDIVAPGVPGVEIDAPQVYHIEQGGEIVDDRKGDNIARSMFDGARLQPIG